MINPRVIRMGASFPMDEVLEISSSSMLLCVKDQFDFIFFLFVFNYQRWLCKWHAIGFHFLIWGKKIDMEYVI